MTAKTLAYDDDLGLYLWEGKDQETGKVGRWICSDRDEPRQDDAEVRQFLKEHKTEVIAAIEARDNSWAFVSVRLYVRLLFALTLGPVGAVKFLWRSLWKKPKRR